MWAAEERRRFQGELVAWEVAFIINRITGEEVDPVAINPYSDRQAVRGPRKSEALLEAESKAGWAALKEFFARPPQV